MRLVRLAVAVALGVAPCALHAMRSEEVFIPMRDGTRLAATLYFPERVAAGERLPVILEYLPYRKDDGTLAGDLALYGYATERGYAGARVDVRGTGRSEGPAPEREYSEQEQRDGVAVIAWLAAQPWSNGNVGMWGWSWGGFNAIQIAARRPPALKAILPGEAAEDLFQDDVHYIDGLFHLDEYELAMEVQPAITRSPDYPLDEKSLRERFDAPPWSLLYKRRQRDGPFWRVSLFPDRYDRIEVPVLMIGGWYDGYRDSIPRMLEKLKAPSWAIVGPWNHSGPDSNDPGPAIDWRAVAVRFFDRYLKGIANGWEKEPRLSVFVRDWHPPGTGVDTIPGRWRAEDGWPIARSRDTTLRMTADRTLSPDVAPESEQALRYVPSAGAAAGFWWGELLPDQRPADTWSLVYDSEPLGSDTEILGFPKALLRATADAPVANWFVRLSDVAPDGSVTLVTGAGLSGAQRDSAADPKPLEPGRWYPLDVEMHFTSWVFPKGHRIRVAVSNALWPMIWPTPYAMTTRLGLGGSEGSRLILPVVAPELRPVPAFGTPRRDPPIRGIQSSGGAWPGAWSICRDEVEETARGEWRGTSTADFPWGRISEVERITYDVSDAEPAVAAVRGEATTTITLSRGRVLVWTAKLQIESDGSSFVYRLTRELFENGRKVREKTWQETIPRDHH